MKKNNKIKACLFSIILMANLLCSLFSSADTYELYAATGGQTSSSDVLNVVLTTSGTVPATMGGLSESTYVATNNTAGQQRGTIALDNSSVGGYMHVNIGQTIDMYAPSADVDYTDVIGFSGNYTFKAAGGRGGTIIAKDTNVSNDVTVSHGGYGSVITNSFIDYNTGQSITYRKGSNGRDVGTSEATNTTYWNYQTPVSTLMTFMGSVNGRLCGETAVHRNYTAISQVGTASYIQVSGDKYIVAGGGAPGAVVFTALQNGSYSATGTNGAHADKTPVMPDNCDGFDNPSAPNMTVRYRDYMGTGNINDGRIAGTVMKLGVPVTSYWGGGVQYEDVVFGWVRNPHTGANAISYVYPGYSGLASRDGSKFSTEGLNDATYSVSIDTNAAQSQPYLNLTCNAKYITINNPTRPGYTFAGWNCGNGVTCVGGNGNSYTYKVTSSGATITATWVANTNTIAYDANGGTGSMSSHTVATEGTFTIKNNEFSAPNGYMFDTDGYAVVRASDYAVFCSNYGWQSLTNNIGSNPANWKRYTQGSQWTIDSAWLNPNHSGGDTFVFYAQWKLATYYINYQKGQTDWTGTVPTKTTCIYNQNVTLQGVGNMKGRSYAINFDSNKTKGESNPTTAETITGNLVGTGWKINNGLYNFGAFLIAPNFIESGTINAIAQWETKTINNLPTVTRKGFTFLGWYDSPTGGNKITSLTVTPGTTAYIKTLYAHWLDISPPKINPDNVITGTPGLTIKKQTEDEIEYNWINTEVNLTFAASDNVEIESIILYDSAGNELVSAENEINYTVTKEGITKYKVIATDTSGNTAILKVTVKIDYVAPQGLKSINYDGYNLTVSIHDIEEKLSGCKKAWIIINAYDLEGAILQTNTRDLTIMNPNQIHDNAEYNGSFTLEDVYNYDSNYMTVEVWITDIAGNERKIGESDTIDTFYLSGYVTRAKGTAEYWKAGEMGYVDVKTGAYVDKLYIIYPDTWTTLDTTLGTHIFDYIGIQVPEKEERDSFYIPIRASNAEYNITVIAEKNGHTKTVILPVQTDGNIISDIRTRIHYNPDRYPIFKDEY